MSSRALIERLRQPPESTYRLQFHAGFTFRNAAAITDYLAELGVTHAYASPYLAARPGSTHGYDVIDHNRLNPEIGAPAEFDAWVESLRRRGMSHLLDIVPNHVGVGTNENRWWNDVLENGPSSIYGHFFDVAWRGSPRPELHDKVLLPLLGAPYAEVLEKGELNLSYERGAFFIDYYERRFPVAPRTYARILARRADVLEQELGPDDVEWLEYNSIVTAARGLPDRSERDPAAMLQRHREKRVIKRRLAALVERCEPVRRFIERTVRDFKGRPGEPRSFDLLDDLLSHQCYRLSYWHVASDEINYRRFFDINDLAALGMEREEVFDATHALLFELLRDGKVGGFRVDHPDGLYDPKQYFDRLQQRAQEESGAPVYVVAEKILAIDEPLPHEWACHGTSGYDFLVMANSLFVDSSNEQQFTDIYRDWLGGESINYDDLVYEKKRLILEISLASELHVLAHRLDRLAQVDRYSRDFTFAGLLGALREVIACFPVYRSYVTDDGAQESDVRNTEIAVEHAIARNPKADPAAFRFVADMVLLRHPPSFDDDAKAAQRQFAGKFQQVTAPTTAKGIEDTAFYVYNRLVSLNEVGGEPQQFGVTPAKLHQYLRERQKRWPYALSTLSTHDTKRSEDVRARINVLSEIPDEWREHVTRWGEINAGLRAEADGHPAPSRNDEYLLYQTLIGAWPLEASDADQTFVQRMQAYLLKAIREAKVFTSWTGPNEPYEQATTDFVARILSHRSFMENFLPFQRRVSRLGLINSLAQTVLKLTAPGVPDTYQGTELWDFSLVDPDNRRPVDYAHRRELLEGLKERPDPRKLLDRAPDGRIKLFVTQCVLRLRREQPGLFTRGEYLPLEVSGAKADHVFACARRHGDRSAVTIIPRLPAKLGTMDRNTWGDTRVRSEVLNGGPWRDLFTDEMPATSSSGILVADVLATLPLAVLTSA